MRNARRFLCAAAIAAAALAAAAGVRAQRPRTADPQTPAPAATPRPAPAPASVKAKYEGGVVGYRKSDGTLNFDDANGRLMFRDKTNRELFSIPYKAVVMAWPDTRSHTSTAGRVISAVPYGGLPGLLMRSKTRYLNIRYQDPDTATEGAASFKLGEKDLLYSVLDTLGTKAELTQRGDAYIRPKQSSQTTPTSGP